MTKLVDDVAKAIADTFSPHGEGEPSSASKAASRAAIAVIGNYLRGTNEDLAQLFVDWRDGSFGWEGFYSALASHLEEQK